MNRPPEILVNNGFPTDANGVLTGIVIPDNVTTQNTPSIVTTYATEINWIPSNAATLTELNIMRMSTINSNGLLNSYTNVTTLRFPEAEYIGTVTSTAILQNLYSLTTLYAPKVKTIQGGWGPVFEKAGLTSLSLPELTTLRGDSSGGCFKECTGLVIVSLPKVTTIVGTSSNGGNFAGCTNLQTIMLGSSGHPVTSIGSGFCKNCTQSGLTITIYTTNGASLSGEPWGATGADILYEEA